MTDLLVDFDANTGDRLWKILELESIDHRDRLEQSARTAGRQLELLKPGVVAATGNGVHAGPAVLELPGTVLIVFAHEEKAITMHLAPCPGHTLAEGIEACAGYARSVTRKGAWSARLTAFAIEDLIRQYGRAPGQTGISLPRSTISAFSASCSWRCPTERAWSTGWRKYPPSTFVPR
jgi:hypothetical protein